MDGAGNSEQTPRRTPGPQQLRQQQKHEEKLKDIREQVADGSLVIRQMTPEERERYGPSKPRAARGRGPKRS